jgi:N-methylhydantoinase B
MVMDAAGGGGYGDPRERQAVERDVREGKLSRESALRDYDAEITASGKS